MLTNFQYIIMFVILTAQPGAQYALSHGQPGHKMTLAANSPYRHKNYTTPTRYKSLHAHDSSQYVSHDMTL